MIKNKINVEDVIIREIKSSEINILENFLYEAIFQREKENLLPKTIIFEPSLYQYIKDFGKTDDSCLVAEIDGEIIGAVWCRILSDDIKGFGNIDEKTPEFTISLIKEYRGKGIGKRLMSSMIEKLRRNNYSRASLSVQKDNYACKLYKEIGFKVLKEKDRDYIMIIDLI